MPHSNEEFRRALDRDGHAAFRDREFPLGDRIRALEWAEPSPQVYAALADEAQSIVNANEFHRGLAAGHEVRAVRLERRLRVVRAAVEGERMPGGVHTFPEGEEESHGGPDCPCLPSRSAESDTWVHNRLLSQ
jgi:hypothetical protein